MGEPGTIAPALDEAFRQRSRLDRIAGLSNTLLHLNAENLDEAKQVYEREYWWIGDIEIELFMEALTRIDPAQVRIRVVDPVQRHHTLERARHLVAREGDLLAYFDRCRVMVQAENLQRHTLQVAPSRHSRKSKCV